MGEVMTEFAPLKKKEVGTVTVAVPYRLIRNEYDNGYELMEHGNDEVLIVGRNLNELRDRLTTELIDVGAPEGFTIEIKV